jgi:hypothetical protein
MKTNNLKIKLMQRNNNSKRLNKLVHNNNKDYPALKTKYQIIKNKLKNCKLIWIKPKMKENL